nr:MAG TPA: Nuclease [Caudoviricetes sp.]
MTEKQLENRMKKYLSNKNIYHFKVHGNGFMRSGIPDLICCVNGHFVAIEIKRPDGKGKVSKLQEIEMDRIKRSDGIAVVMNNYDEFVKFISEIKNGANNEN